MPKDIRAFMARAGEVGADQALTFLREVDAINMRRRQRVIDLAREELGSVIGRNITVLGAAFKPDSDDVRDSPALDVAARLHELGADVVVHDPQAVDNARRTRPQLTYADSALDALAGARVVVLATEWNAYLGLDPAALLPLVAPAPAVVDARNALDPAAWRAAGWTYRGLGRP